MKDLNERQRCFVQEYLVDLNATQAAIRAGYSRKTARSLGQRLLTKADIQEAIQTAQDERSRRTGITQDRVLEELAAIGFAKATDYAEAAGDTATIRPTGELTPKQAAAIAGLEAGKYGVKLKLHDKVRALELLGRHLGMFASGNTGEAEGEVQIIDDL